MPKLREVLTELVLTGKCDLDCTYRRTVTELLVSEGIAEITASNQVMTRLEVACPLLRDAFLSEARFGLPDCPNPKP
ncbi:hypothetical protein WJX72_011571 [[Myrmecia] bisecta]|uniref:Uncharacterized protein n=1 Tax=[Myrmecia] bisecta TaxID=41462 RepID=A0AAW1QC64_9CHLO